MDATANSAVSCVMPTLTQPLLAVDVVHAVGRDLAQLLVLEVVHVDALRIALAADSRVPPLR